MLLRAHAVRRYLNAVIPLLSDLNEENALEEDSTSCQEH